MVEPKNSAGLFVNFDNIFPTLEPCFLLSSIFMRLALTKAISIPAKNVIRTKDAIHIINVTSIR